MKTILAIDKYVSQTEVEKDVSMVPYTVNSMWQELREALQKEGKRPHSYVITIRALVEGEEK